VARGKLDKRISLTGDQEFVQLGHDFNIMAQNLQEAETYRQRFTADLSHELRTPLTLLRGQLEGMQAGSIPADNENVTLLLDEVIRLSRLVKELDNLALLEKP
jgi:signal transduction histidine kinase